MTATQAPVSAPPQASGQPQHRPDIRVWDAPLRLFHWALVTAVALAFLSSDEDSALNQWHVVAGWIAAILIVFRLVWGFVGGEHSRFSDFVRPSKIKAHVRGLIRGRFEATVGHNPLGGVSVLVLLLLVAITVWTGAFGGEPTEDLHELVAWVLLAFVALHVTAVIVMSLLEKENLVRAMITGKKPAVRHPQTGDAKSPNFISWVTAAVVVVATVYAILRYDPQAFTLRQAQSFEVATGEPSEVAGEQETGERQER